MDNQTLTITTLENDLMKLARRGWRIEIVPQGSAFGNIYADVILYSPDYKSKAVNPILESDRVMQGMNPTVPCVTMISLFEEGALAKVLRQFCAIWIDPIPG